MNSWNNAGFRKAVEATGKNNIIVAGLWTEVYVTWPALNMLDTTSLSSASKVSLIVRG